jgi:signal transduction histidine kinase
MFSPSSVLSDKTLLKILYQSPIATAIYTGEELHIVFANSAMCKLWNIAENDIKGKTYNEIRRGSTPNLTRQLQRVWQTGLTYSDAAAPYTLTANGYIYTQYYNIELSAYKNADGPTIAVVHTAVPLNKTGVAKHTDAASFATSSIDQTAAVKAITNNLFDAPVLETLIDDASIGVVITAGEENKILYVNRAYSQMISRNIDSLRGSRLFDILPEAEAYFAPIINEVRNNRRPVYLYDTPYSVYDNGETSRGYVNVIYQPFTHPLTGVKGVLAICHDVTLQTINKQQLETFNAELKTTNHDLQLNQTGLRLAADTAKLGIWTFNPETNEFGLDARCRGIFGLDANEVITKADVGTVIDEKNVNLVNQLVQNAYAGKPGMVEYYAINRKTGKRSWVRGSAQFIPPSANSGGQLIGTMIDLSAEKDEEKRKTDFIGFVSHELRSPLTSLSGYIQVLQLRASKVGDEKINDLITKSRRQVDRMAALISGFLDVVKMGEGGIQLDLSVFDLADLLSASEDECATVVQTHKMVYRAVTGAIVEADYDKIEQVLTNLINNAVKYSPQGTTITVAAERLDDEVKVSVADEGLGISPADIPNLFDRFYRAQSEHTKTIKGFGIGLYICKEIIESHNGRIWVESEIGKCSVFYFSLPLASLPS